MDDQYGAQGRIEVRTLMAIGWWTWRLVGPRWAIGRLKEQGCFVAPPRASELANGLAVGRWLRDPWFLFGWFDILRWSAISTDPSVCLVFLAAAFDKRLALIECHARTISQADNDDIRWPLDLGSEN